MSISITLEIARPFAGGLQNGQEIGSGRKRCEHAAQDAAPSHRIDSKHVGAAPLPDIYTQRRTRAL